LPTEHNPLPIGRFPSNEHFTCALDDEWTSAPQLLYELIYHPHVYDGWLDRDEVEEPHVAKDGRLCFGARCGRVTVAAGAPPVCTGGNLHDNDAYQEYTTVGYFFEHVTCGGEPGCVEQ